MLAVCRDFASAADLPSGWLDGSTPPQEEALTLYAVLGIKDPLRPDVAEAVETCQRVRALCTMPSEASQCNVIWQSSHGCKVLLAI